MAKVGEVINDGAEYIKWEMSFAQGLQYEMIYWIKRDYRIEKVHGERGKEDESLNDIFPQNEI